MPIGSKLSDETKDDTTSFLPASAESTEVVNILDDRFASGETTQGLIVYQRDGGLTAADRRRIAADARALAALPEVELPLAQPPIVPFAPGSPGQLVAKNGELAYTVVVLRDQLRQGGRLGQHDPRHRPGTRTPACESCSPATSASRRTPTRSSPTST